MSIPQRYRPRPARSPGIIASTIAAVKRDTNHGLYALHCHAKTSGRNRSIAANRLVQARINGEIKEEAAAVLAAMGLTVSDAVRLLLTRIAREKALPFEPLIPNAATVEAMKEARKGGPPRCDTVEDLMADLHTQD